MRKKLVIHTVPTEFQRRLTGGWFHSSLLFALMSLLSCTVVMETRTLAQENEPTRIETEFKQGDESYPATILLDRVAVVLTEKAMVTDKTFSNFNRKLGGKPIRGLPRNVVAIDVPDAYSIADLTRFNSVMLQERVEDLREFGDLSEFIADRGVLVTVAGSETPRIMTDRIIVWVDADREPDFIQGILGEFNAEIVRRNPFNPRSFLIRLIRVPADRNTLEISNAINGQPGVSFALPDFYIPGEFRQSSVVPDDEFFGEQWHLRNVGQGYGTEDADIDVDLAWAFGAGNSDVLIAVIDSGFQIDHQDLADAVWTHPGEVADNCLDDDGNGFVDDVHGWDFTSCRNACADDEGGNIVDRLRGNVASCPELQSSTSCPDPRLAEDYDPEGHPAQCGDNDVTPDEAYKNAHGTSVAGAAVARAFNGRSQASHLHEGVVGVCPNCSLLPIRISANGKPHYSHEVAIDYAQSMGADVINISWGYEQGEPVPMNVQMTLDQAASQGAVIFVAMTNDEYENCEPEPSVAPDLSAHPTVIAVAGSTNRDLVSPGGFGRCLSVLAPTDDGKTDLGTLRAATTDLEGYDGYNARDQALGDRDCNNPDTVLDPDRAYTFCFGGLSFSAPLAAGVAGLVLSHDASLPWRDVKRLLQDTADKISDSEAQYSVETGYSAPANDYDPLKYGYGRLNAFEAVRVVADPFFGRGGVDIFVRDNRLDWGNTEQLSSVDFEASRRFIPYWQSVDIKIDAPPFRTSPPGDADELACLNPATRQTRAAETNASIEAPQTSLEFGCFAHEDPTPGVLNKVYVRAHNRGINSATNVRVKLLWATHPDENAPDLPNDFWSAFASQMDASNTSTWHPLSTQTVASLAYSGASVAGTEDDASAIFAFDFNAPVFDQDDPSAGHLTMLAILDSRDDPISPETTLSQDLAFITPRDNNVTQLTIPLGAQMIAGLTDQQFDVRARRIGRRFGSLEYRRARWHFARPQ